MRIYKEYKFPVSISKETFIDKIIAKAMMGEKDNEIYKETRVRYGFSEDSTVHFVKQYVTSDELLKYLSEGHSVCHIFNSKHDYITKGSKNNKNFKEAYMIGVDIDDTSYPTMEAYLSKLSLKPTLYYTSYSHMQENKGVRFRMFYVFDRCIATDPYSFRYIANRLYQIIERDINPGKTPEDDDYEKIKDQCGLKCSQYMNGTNKFNTEIEPPVYDATYNIYSIEDLFGSLDEYYRGFVNYLENRCDYASVDTKQQNDIKHLLHSLTGTWYNYSSKDKAFIKASETLSTSNVIETPDVNRKCSRELVRYLKLKGFNGYDDVIKKYMHQIPYVYRKEKPIWIDNEYQFVDDDYFSLYFNLMKVKDGHHRREKLYQIMKLRRLIYPKADADMLLYNAYIDVYRFFEVDHDLNIDCLVRNVECAINCTLDEIYNDYKEIIEELQRTRRPKYGIILKRGLVKTTAEYNEKLKEIRWRIAAQNYNTEIPFKENLEYINENIFPIKARTLRDICKYYNITLSEKIILTDEEALEFIDVNMSERQLLQMFKDNNISIGRERIRKLKKQKESGLPLQIPREDTGLPLQITKEEWTSDANSDIMGSLVGVGYINKEDKEKEDNNEIKDKDKDKEDMNTDIDEKYRWMLEVTDRIEHDDVIQKYRKINLEKKQNITDSSSAKENDIKDKEKEFIKVDYKIPQQQKRSKQEELNELKHILTLDGITTDFLGIHNYTKDIDVRMVSSNNQDSFESMFI